MSLGLGCDPSALLGAQPDPTDEEPEEDEENEPDPTPPDVPAGTCTSWKYAYCDAIVACSAFVSREQCELDLGWLVCQSKADLGKCEQKIRAALEDEDCEELPQDCGPSTIADRSMPRELCEEIHREMCEFRFFCGLEFSTEACLETLTRTEPCDAFTSFLPTAVDCAEAYGKLGCEEGMPSVCKGVLRY